MSKLVWDTVRSIEDRQSTRYEDLRDWYLLAFGRDLEQDVDGTGGSFMSRGFGFDDEIGSGGVFRYNIIAVLIEAVAAKIAKNKPVAMPLTQGGGFAGKRQAEGLEKFIRGQVHHLDVYQKMQRAFLNAAWSGTGVLKICNDGDDIKCDCVFPLDIVIDEREAVDGEPRTIYQKMRVHRSALLSMFEDDKEARTIIEEAPAVPAQTSGGYRSDSDMHEMDMLDVVEGWRLPSGKGKKDGKHVIAIFGSEAPLVEDWERDRFPFAFYAWRKPVRGFWGHGIAERRTGDQYELNKLLDRIEKMVDLNAVSRVYINDLSDVNDEDITNQVGAVVRYNGNVPPAFSTPPTIPPDLFNHIASITQRAFEAEGVSQLTATSQIPKGLQSKPALETYNDLETERFSIQAQDWERFFLDCAELMIEEAQALDERLEGGYSVQVEDKRAGISSLEAIKWGEVSLERSKYELKIFPVGFLPSHPSGKIERIQTLIELGVLGPETAGNLLDFPDVESEMKKHVSPQEFVDWQIELIIDEGRADVVPDPFFLAEAIDRGRKSYGLAVYQEYPDERLQRLRDYVTAAEMMLAEATEPPPAPPVEAPLPEEMMGLEGVAPPPQAAGAPIPGEEMLALPPEALAGL